MNNGMPQINISTKTPVEEVKKLAGNCLKCGHCCKYGSGFLISDDKKKIAKFLQINEDELSKQFLEKGEKFNTTLQRPKMMRKGKPYGECVFYDNKQGCTIHDVKPLHCRIGHCNQHGEYLHLWFTINYFVNKNDPESIRQWATYLKTHPTIPGGELDELVPDKELLKKILSYEILR